MANEKHKSVLVVDDEEPVRAICTRMLAPLGYTVAIATNGEEALTLLDKRAFDLVLTDYRMPGQWNGLALGQVIKKRFPQTQIMLMTAFPAVDTAVESLRMGAFDYLIKPFEQMELISRVRACFEKQSAASS